MKRQKVIFNLYNIAWKILLPFLKRTSFFKDNYPLRITPDIFKKTDIWIHGASGGEAYIATEILKHLKPCSPQKILYTATTIQGIKVMESFCQTPDFNPDIDYKITWLPFDMPAIIEQVVKKTNPGIMVLLETELWPGLLYMLKKHKIKTIIINGRLSSKTYLRYLKTKFLWENISPEIILATSEKDKQRFKNIFGKKAQIGIMPNIKFDAIPSTTETKSSIMVQLAEILPSDIPLSILASIRKEEENHLEKIIQYLIQKFPDQIIAIFPKHMQRINPLSKMLARLANKTGIKWQLKSMINNKLDKKTIILWDTFGELKHAYAFATTAFVGGSLEPLGGQNFLEPVISGAATITGPFLNSFKWINKEIFNSNIVFKAQNAHEVGKFMVQQLTNPPDKEKIKQKSLEYIRKNQGGTALAIKIINKNLKN